MYLWLDDFFILERLSAPSANTLSALVKYFLFSSEYVLAISILYLACHTNRILGTLILLILCIFITIDVTLHNIYGRPADLNNIGMLNAAVANLNDVIQQYHIPIAKAIGKVCLLFIPLIILTFKNQTIKHASKLVMLLITILAILYTTVMLTRDSSSLFGFPKGFSYSFGSIAHLVNKAMIKQNKVSPIKTAKYDNLRKNINNIIVVIDESVEYSIFSKVLANNSLDKNVFNLGRAFSGANCSAASNYMIRKGIIKSSSSPNNLNIIDTDSLFEIAKRNGFSTYYINNQATSSNISFENHMSEDELQFIDHIILSTSPTYKRDIESLQELSQIATSGKNFIYINKYGSHFPYSNTIPPEIRTGNDNKDYLLSVSTNAVEFMHNLASALPPNTIVFYTSDHGESIDTLHCNTENNINPREFLVPAIIITDDDTLQKNIQTNMHLLKNKLNHFNLSESIRNLLGEKIEGNTSIFNFHEPSSKYCGLYGHPFKFFGKLPPCRQLDIKNYEEDI